MSSKTTSGASYLSSCAGFWLLVALVLWFGNEMVWSGKVPFYRDLGTYFYPMRFTLAESFKAGELPLWDRHIGMGLPFLANIQAGVFYPPHLLYLALPFWVAVKAIFLFHYLLAATGCYMLLRQWKYPPYLAIVGALLFSLGGAIVSLTNLMDHFQTAVWLPWVVFCWERALRSGCWRDFVTFTLISLIQFLAGSPELYAMGSVLILLDGLRIHTTEGRTTYRKTFLLLASANALVVGVAMVQLLPTMELILESRRQQPLPYSEATMWSFHPLSLISLVFPDKEVETQVVSGMNLFFGHEPPLFVSQYMGALTLLGFCLWLFDSRLKEKAVLFGLTVISLVFALGHYTPIYFFLYQYVPLLDRIRFPEKFFFLTHVFLLLATLRGLRRFLESRDSPHRRSQIALLAVGSLFLLSYVVLRLEREPLVRFIAWVQSQPVSLSALDKSSGLLVHLERQSVLIWSLLLLFFFGKKAILRKPLFEILLLAIVFVDLNSAHQPFQYLLKPGFVDKGPRVIMTPDPQLDRLFYYPGPDNLHPNYFRVLRRRLSLAESSSLVYGNLLPDTGVFYGFDYMQETGVLFRWPYGVFLGVAREFSPDELYKLLGSLNVKYITSFRPLPEKGIALARHFPEHPSWLYRIKQVIPRAYIVSKTVQEEDPVRILQRLSSKEFDPSKEVILGEPSSIIPRRNFQARAEIVDYRDQGVTIRASLNSPGILVLADSYYPGWKAYVDGKQEEILRANLFFRGVPLSPGEHLVEFRYRPRSFTIGLIISLTTLCGVVIGSIVSLAVKRKRAAPPYDPSLAS